MPTTGIFGTTGSTFASVVCNLLGLIYTIEWLLGILALAIFILGIIRFIRNASSTKSQKEGYQLMIWGLVAMFVIFSMQGILWLLYSSFIGTSLPSGTSACSAVSAIHIGRLYS